MNMLSEWPPSNGLMPHGFCYLWNPTLIWLHAISDTLIALAYFLIPVALLYFVRKRRDIAFRWMFVCFGVFIAACGATHAMEVWTLWVPSYWFSGGVKVITAIASVPTAVFLVRLMPTALSLPGPEEMRAANEQLTRQAATLKKTEERFRQMADNIQEIFWILDPQTKEVSYVSPAFEQICELPLDSLYSNPTSYRELIHPEDRQRVLAELEKLESTNHFDEEFRIICPSGTVKWIRAIGFTAKDRGGNVRTLVGTAQEITARKEMETVLRESEDRYRDLVEHSTDLICTHNLQGRLLSVNELPAKLLGYSREELLNKPMRDFLLPEARAQFDESLLRIQKDGFVKGLMVVLTKTGERRIREYQNTLRTEGVTVPIVRGIAHDVTDQKRLEKALRLSEEKFSKAFHSSPVEILITTLQEGLFLDVNEAFERNSGFTRDELIGHTSIELGLWDNPDERPAVIEEMKKYGRLQGRVIRFRTKAGRTRVKRYAAEQIEIGRKQCLLAVCEDITERKRAEAALHKAEEQFSAILNHCPNLIFLKDVEGRYLLINKEYRKTYHFTRDQIYGKKDIEVFPPDQAAVFRGSDLKVLRARAPMEFEEVAHHDDGPHTSIVQKFPLFDARGEIYAICGFVTDITERKRAEERMREYEKAVEGLEEMIVVVDRQHRYLLANRAFLNYQGMEREQLVGRLVAEVLDREVYERVIQKKLDECLRGEVVKFELKYNYPALGERDLFISYFPIEGPAGVDRVAGVLQDITDRKRAEEERRRLSGQLLHLQDEERQRIARDLHDSTGQDLVALGLSLGQLRGSIPSSSGKARKLASECQALALQCVREVRTLSYVLHPPMLDEAGLEEAIRQYVEGFTERCGVRVKLEMSPRIGRMAREVELALFRVVQESLTNIQRHSGSLQAKIQIDRNSDLFTLEISDRGRGLSGRAPRRNGERQFKVGVGFPSMQERVKLIGGRLEIESTSHGTIVRVTIPDGSWQREEA